MMRFLFVLVLFFCGVFPAVSFGANVPEKKVSDQEKKSAVHWLDYTEALKHAKVQQKLVFVDMYADWCVPCRIMDVNVYSDTSVANLLNERFLPVKLDTDSKEKISCDGRTEVVFDCFRKVWELEALPALVLVAPKGLSILTVTQSMDAAEMRDLLLKFLSKEKEWIAR